MTIGGTATGAAIAADEGSTRGVTIAIDEGSTRAVYDVTGTMESAA